MAQHKWHKEIKAWADGAEIMCKKPNGDWVIVEQPKWIELDEYRIKPQPKKPQYLYVYKDYIYNSMQFEINKDNKLNNDDEYKYIGKIKLETEE